MSGIKYLADTNCFIHLLNENPLFLPFAEDRWAFSYITEIELLSKKDLSQHADEVIRQMLETCFKVNHSQILTDLSISIRKNNKIKLPDAIIAASALLLNLPLITADKDFATIKEIDCIILDI